MAPAVGGVVVSDHWQFFFVPHFVSLVCDCVWEITSIKHVVIKVVMELFSMA